MMYVPLGPQPVNMFFYHCYFSIRSLTREITPSQRGRILLSSIRGVKSVKPCNETCLSLPEGAQRIWLVWLEVKSFSVSRCFECCFQRPFRSWHEDSWENSKLDDAMFAEQEPVCPQVAAISESVAFKQDLLIDLHHTHWFDNIKEINLTEIANVCTNKEFK